MNENIIKGIADNTPKIPKAICGSSEQPLKISSVEIPCYVLDNGKRVIVRMGMIKSLGMSEGGSSNYQPGNDRLTTFIGGKILKPFIHQGIIDLTSNPILFKTNTGVKAYGYEATLLADICDAVLEARRHGVLQKQQLHIADKCEVLLRGFARVGIIALVDEVTGYQEIRNRNELHKILEAYIAKELLPWTKMFPDEFYQEMFRLRGWDFKPNSVKKPVLVGKLTNSIVYSRLPSGVLVELRVKTPRYENGKLKHHFHRLLTPNIGHPHLERHLSATTALMRASKCWDSFLELMNRAFPLQKDSQQLILDIDPSFEDDNNAV